MGIITNSEGKLLLPVAQSWAEALVAHLRPHCTRIHIAGSIRRQKEWVKDIEIVCIPKYREMTAAAYESSLFSDTQVQTVEAVTEKFWHEALKHPLMGGHIKGGSSGKMLCRELNVIPEQTLAFLAQQYGADKDNAVLEIADLPHLPRLDLFTATEKNYANILIIRTGSADWNRAVYLPALKRAGYKSEEGQIKEIETGRVVELATEEALADYLGIEIPEPSKRNV